MAINKNFVVKNGIEVNTNLIVADTDSNKVGIGTTVPEYTLHVFQGTGIGASSVNITGIGTFLEELNVGLAGTTLTVLSNDSVAGTGGSIGVGTALPAYVLDVRAPVSTGQTALYVQGDMRVTGDINIDDISIGDLNVSGISTFAGNVITSGITTLSSSGGITTTGGDLFVDGGAEVTGLTTITGVLDANNTTQSSSSTTGAAKFAGGVGVAKNLYVGGGAEVTGLTTITGVLDANNTTQSSSSTTGAAQFAGGMGIAKNLFVGGGAEVTGLTTITGVLDANNTTQSSSSTTGAAKFAGGVGIEKQLYVGAGASVGAGLTVKGNLLPEADGTRDLGASGTEWKDLYIDGTANIDALSADTAAIGDLTDNRVVIAGSSGELEDSADLTFDGTTLAIDAIIDSNDATQSSSSATGSLQVAGGAGIAKNLYVGGGAEVTGLTTITGVLDANNATQSSSSTTGAAQFAGGVGIAKNLFVGGGSEVTGILTVTNTLDANGALDVDGHTELDDVNVAGFSTFVNNIDFGYIGMGATVGFGSTAFFKDHAKAIFGNGEDLKVYHNGSDSYIQNTNSGSNLLIESAFGTQLRVNSSEVAINAVSDGTVELYHNNAKKFETTASGVIATGINTAGAVRITDNLTPTAGQGLELFCPDTSSSTIQSFDRTNGETDKLTLRGNPVELKDSATIRLVTNSSGVLVTGIATVSSTAHLTVPVGTTAQRDSIVANGMIRYNTTLNSYEGYGNGAWGGLGGGTEIDTSVSSTSATSITTFAHAEYRSAYFRVQIVQGSAYQVGRYLLIHDGTTVTIVEESAVATGDMLGTITAAIVSTNVVVSVNMYSASSATVTTIIDKITV